MQRVYAVAGVSPEGLLMFGVFDTRKQAVEELEGFLLPNFEFDVDDDESGLRSYYVFPKDMPKEIREETKEIAMISVYPCSMNKVV